MTLCPAAGEAYDECEGQGALIDSAEIPGGGKLYLVQHGLDYEIMSGEEQLMGSWTGGSERALATLVCERLAGDTGRLLIGGLGMGFTLKAALDVLPASAEIVVAELVPKIVTWAEGRLAHIFAGSLSDPRVSIEVRDVHDMIVKHPGEFDAILLDVDNGPDGLVSLANERLYCNWGLRAARQALRPGGILAIWSAYPDDAFANRLQSAGFAVEQRTIEADGHLQQHEHTVWLAFRLEDG